MALVVLMSTTSFTIIEHYCGGELVDTTLFSTTEACDDEPVVVKEGACCEVVVNKDCCNDIVYVAEGMDELLFKSVELPKFEKSDWIISTLSSYENCFVELQKQFIPFREYIPPNLVFDTHILNQVFRI